VTIPEHTVERDEQLKQLRWTLTSFAAVGSDQQALFPDHVEKPGTLALEFDRCVSVIRGENGPDLSGAQASVLTAIEEKLATIARDSDAFDTDLWTDEALRSSEHWADVRRLARAALEAFGWPIKEQS
jgi:hypothetical protein